MKLDEEEEEEEGGREIGYNVVQTLWFSLTVTRLLISLWQQSPNTLSSGVTVSANYKYIKPAGGCVGVCPVGDYAKKGHASQVSEKEVSSNNARTLKTRSFFMSHAI